jgi:hypothetical protein
MNFSQKSSTLLILITILIIKQSNCDIINRIGKKLKIEISTRDVRDDKKLLIGDDEHSAYIQLQHDETIKVTCRKQGMALNGTIIAFVNTMEANVNLGCDLAPLSALNDDYFCQQKSFLFKIIAQGYTYYKVSCRFVETNQQDTVDIYLKRLCKFIKFEKFEN